MFYKCFPWWSVVRQCGLSKTNQPWHWSPWNRHFREGLPSRERIDVVGNCRLSFGVAQSTDFRDFKGIGAEAVYLSAHEAVFYEAENRFQFLRWKMKNLGSSPDRRLVQFRASWIVCPASMTLAELYCTSCHFSRIENTLHLVFAPPLLL